MADGPHVALSVDALSPRLTGIGRYCFELVQRLPSELGTDKVSYFRGDHWINNPLELLHDDWKPARRSAWRRRYDQWQRSRKLKSTVVHGPNYFLPVWAERGVATIHDLSVHLYPETHPADRIRAFEERFEHTLRQARLLITDSATVRQELIDIYGVSPDRVRSVPLGIPQVPSNPDFASLQTHDLQPGRYLLCVSTFEPRKRIEHLVAAYSMLPAATRREFPLVLAGAEGWHNEALNASIEEASKDGTVRRLGFVPQQLLDVLYAGAGLFIYPSRYEGFGLPVVEAMAHGIPCIIGNAACLIEVAQGAAVIVDPEDLESFSEAIATALASPTWRDQAAAAGRMTASLYCWDRCVTETAEIYRSLAD